MRDSTVLLLPTCTPGIYMYIVSVHPICSQEHLYNLLQYFEPYFYTYFYKILGFCVTHASIVCIFQLFILIFMYQAFKMWEVMEEPVQLEALLHDISCNCTYSTSHKKVKIPHRSSTKAVPKQYGINTELTPNVERTSTVMYIYMYAVRCGAVCAVRDAGRALHARAIALAGAVRYGTDF